MGGDGTNRAIGVMRQSSETIFRIFRHGLNLKTKDAQLVHHPGNTVGYHSQVFCTNQHSGGLRQPRQFLHGLLIPELVVTTIEIVVIQLIESILLSLVQLVVALLELYGDTWMPSIITFMIHQEQVIAERHAIAFYLLATHS